MVSLNWPEVLKTLREKTAVGMNQVDIMLQNWTWLVSTETWMYSIVEKQIAN